MKNKFYCLFIAVIPFISCSKYEEGDNSIFKSKMKRVVGDWNVSYFQLGNSNPDESMADDKELCLYDAAIVTPYTFIRSGNSLQVNSCGTDNDGGTLHFHISNMTAKFEENGVCTFAFDYHNRKYRIQDSYDSCQPLFDSVIGHQSVSCRWDFDDHKRKMTIVAIDQPSEFPLLDHCLYMKKEINIIELKKDEMKLEFLVPIFVAATGNTDDYTIDMTLSAVNP